jgi:MerR family transcriptional regulator, copper efflux regulator
MLISEFVRATGLTPDTVRFYVRRGLLKPLTGSKGGSNPYQVFTDEHVQMARTVRMAQSLGFSLREIAALNVEYQAKRMTTARGAEVLRAQLGRLEDKGGPCQRDDPVHQGQARLDGDRRQRTGAEFH